MARNDILQYVGDSPGERPSLNRMQAICRPSYNCSTCSWISSWTVDRVNSTR